MKLLGRVALVAVAYWVAGRLALLMAIPPGYATAVWPAAGIALVALLRWGRPAMVGVYLGSFAVNVASGFDAIAIALVVAVGAVVEATVGAALIRRRVRAPTMLEEEGDVLRFIGLGGPVACLIGATWGVGTLLARGAVTWADVPFSWFTWWVGDTVGVALVAAPLLMQVGPERPSRRRRLAVAGPMLAGVIGVIFVFVQVSAFEDHRRRDQLVQRAVPITHAIEARLDTYEESVMMVGSLFAASEEVTADEFRTFTAPLLARNPEIEGVSWNPVDGPRVWIQYMEPPAAAAGLIGQDIADEPIRHEALQRAGRTRAPAATGPLTLFQRRGMSGFLLVAPVFAGTTLRGYAVGVLAIDDVVAAAVRALDVDGLALVVEDEGSPGAAVYRRGDALAGAPWWTARIDLGGRRWRVDVAPTPAYFGSLRGWLGWIVLAGGLVFVSLLGMLTLVTTGRTSRIERQAERAAAAEVKYRDLYEHAPDLHASLDLDGRIFDCNQTFVDVVGASRFDLAGRSLEELHDPSCAAALAAAVARFRAHGTVEDTNLVLRVRGGRRLDVSLRVAAVLDDHGALAHGRAVWRDVSARRQAERDQQILLELSEAAGRVEHVAELRLAVAQGLGAHLGAARCIFHEIDLVGDRAQIDADYHHGVPPLAGTTYVLSQFSAATQADMRAGRVVVNDDVRLDPRTARGDAGAYAALAIRAYVAVPLLRDGEWRASLWIAHAEPHAWRPHEVALVHTVAEKAWLWIEHVRLRAELRALNEELERRVDDRTAALRDAVREKEILLKEIHHRVKNNLQVISSLLSLQSHHLVDPVARQMFEDSKARVQAIAMVHESLYKTRDLAKIDFAEYVQTLVGGLLHAHDGAGRGVVAALDLGLTRLPVNVAIPCGLVISELVTNALKHAFPAGRRGTVSVTLRVDGARATLTVADDGVGLPPALDPRKAPSLGLELVFTFAEQLQATVDLRRAPGTSFTFGFELEAA